MIPRFVGKHSLVNVLYEDNHLLVVAKPPRLATMGLAEGVPTLLSLAKDYIKRKYKKPGNVYLGVVSRLDAPVTGVVLLARTSKAAARLSEQFRKGTPEKTYLAIVEGAPAIVEDDFVDWLAKHERHRRVEVVSPSHPLARQSRLAYRRLRSIGGDSLLEVRPATGRKHQIRVQLAHRGHAILGDYKYGSRRAFPAGIALHAWRLVVEHPVRREPIEFIAPLPEAWPTIH